LKTVSESGEFKVESEHGETLKRLCHGGDNMLYWYIDRQGFLSKVLVTTAASLSDSTRVFTFELEPIVLFNQLCHNLEVKLNGSW